MVEVWRLAMRIEVMALPPANTSHAFVRSQEPKGPPA